MFSGSIELEYWAKMGTYLNDAKPRLKLLSSIFSHDNQWLAQVVAFSVACLELWKYAT